MLEEFTYKVLKLLLLQPFQTILHNHAVSMTIREGDLNIIAVSCLAIGIGSIHYQWKKYHLFNNSWISPSHRAVSTTSPSLSFSVIAEEDEGVYHCVVTSNDGSVFSNNATVHVYGE